MKTEIWARHRIAIVGLCVFIVGLVLYLPGMAGVPMAGDPAVFCTRGALLLLDSFAQTHSLYLLIGHGVMQATGLSAALALSLVSAVFGALTVAGVAVLAWMMCRDVWGAVAAAMSLLVAHTFWMYAVMPEVYTLNLLFLMVMMISAWRWLKSDSMVWLSLIAFLGAWGSLNHMSAGLNAAVILTWALWVSFRRGVHWRHWAAATLAGGVGLVPLGFLFFRDAGVHGFSTALTLVLSGGSGVTGESLKYYGGAMFGLGGVRAYGFQGVACVLALCYNFAGPQLAFAGIGAWELRSVARRFGGLLLWVFVVNFGFSATYAINEFWAFLLPCWFVVAVVSGVGWSRFFRFVSLHRRVSFLMRVGVLIVMVGLPVATYRAALFCVRRVPIDRLAAKRELGQVAAGKDYYAFYLWPPKRLSSGADAAWLDAVEATVENGDVVAARQAYYNLLVYAKLVEHRFDENLVVGLNGASLRRRLQFGQRVFIVHPTDFADTGLADYGYGLERLGPLYRVIRN